MPNWKRVIVSGSDAALTSVIATAGFTGSLLGTASYATNALSASYALTASYATNGGVTQIIAGPNITVSPTTGVGQVTISSTGGGGGTGNTATGSYGSFYSTQTQTNVASTARSMSLNTTDITNGVSISGSTNPYNTYIKTENAGVYDIQFSAQVDKTDSGTDEIWIWIRKNGTDISDSATSVQLQGNGAHYVAAWNFFVNAAANDYFQLMWYSPDANVRLHAEAGFGVVPGIPSLIVTANRVDQFLSNTGSFSGSFTGNLICTASYATSTAAVAGTTNYIPKFATATTLGNSQIFESGSNIGIGTTTPSEKLEVNGNALIKTSFVGTVAAFGDNYASFSHTSRAGTGNYSILSENDGTTYLNASTGKNLKFRIDNIDKAILDSNGNFGIATTTPNAKLDVNGNAIITGSLVVTTGITGTLTGTASYATNALSASYAPGGAGTPTFPYTGSAIISGSLEITGSVFVQDINGIINIDSSNRKLYDTNSSQSVAWDERRLYDIDGNRAVAWQSKILGESNGGSSVSWDYPNQTQAVQFSSYTRNNIDLGVVGENFANFPAYAAFLPQGEILKNGVTFDGGVVDFDLVYLETDNTWYRVSVATTGSRKMLGVAFGIANFDNQVLIEGTMVVNDGTYTDTPIVSNLDHGLPIYIKTGGGIYMSTTAPGSSGDNVRVLGHAYYQSVATGSYWIMKFRPSNSWVTI